MDSAAASTYFMMGFVSAICISVIFNWVMRSVPVEQKNEKIVFDSYNDQNDSE
jgi:hypothetical protein